MKRWTLDMPNGYAMVDEDGWGRWISDSGLHRGYARDLDPEKDKELMDRVRREGKLCGAPIQLPPINLEDFVCMNEETPKEKVKLIIKKKVMEQPKLF